MVMKRLVIIIGIFFLILNALYSQLLNNKLTIRAGYSAGFFLGNSAINDENMDFPSVYSNYNGLNNGLSVNAVYNYKPFYSIGIGIDYLIANNWENSEYDYYADSKLKLYSLSPVFQFHNKFNDIGIFNKLKLYIELAPSMGISSLKLSEPLFDVQGENDTVYQVMNSNDFFYGIKAGAGVDLSLNQFLGIFLNYSYQFSWVSSDLYLDKHFSNSTITLGLFIRLRKEKLYFY